MSNFSEAEIYWLWLYSIEGIGAQKFYEIIKHFEDAKTAYENVAQIQKEISGIGEKIAENLANCANDDYIANLLKSVEVEDINTITRLNSNYPHTLGEIELPPPVLFYKGSLTEEIACAIIGSRKPTKYGYKVAKNMGYELAQQGLLVVSGMALGIDCAAHTGAIEGGGKTFAVLGCGVDVIYPNSNRHLYEKIIENGAVISEFFPKTGPLRAHFPQRNRIISGLCDVLIVGEGSERSGARITVDYALKQGKEVYTLLCDFNSTMSNLPKYLLESGASAVVHAKEVIEDMGWSLKTFGDNSKNLCKNLDLFQNEIYNLLLKQSYSGVEIAHILNKDIKDVNIALTMLELNGYITNEIGNKYIINI